MTVEMTNGMLSMIFDYTYSYRVFKFMYFVYSIFMIWEHIYRTALLKFTPVDGVPFNIIINVVKIVHVHYIIYSM